MTTRTVAAVAILSGACLLGGCGGAAFVLYALPNLPPMTTESWLKLGCLIGLLLVIFGGAYLLSQHDLETPPG